MMYHLYHIPGKKIGVTCDLNNRVTVQQGYNPEEYEVLESSDDIDYISSLEIERQREYGYRVDMVPYKNLKPEKNMKINTTEQTTTFPCPVNKLKGQLMDNIGMTWEHPEFGQFKLTVDLVTWIMQNVKTSMFNNDRSYVYNKAMSNFINRKPDSNVDMFILESTNDNPTDDMFDKIRKWALVRGLYQQGNSNTQYVKLQEEAGELAKALLKNDKPEVIDAIGDMVVVLTNLAHLEGVKIETCIATAYDVISKRTGKMINGTFVKDEN
jgi:NTP pyrophosphatase (non-canonical NTP hydrolase)